MHFQKLSPKQLLYQKVVKPGVERRRRARINQSVEQLKEMLLKNNKLKCLQPRIEKADILEMTLQYIREHSMTRGSTDSDFQAGFQHCLLLTHHFLSTTGHFLSNTVSPATKTRQLQCQQKWLTLATNNGNARLPVAMETITKLNPESSSLSTCNIPNSQSATSSLSHTTSCYNSSKVAPLPVRLNKRMQQLPVVQEVHWRPW
ncbi:enhancer of split m7 protein-like [Acipenser ruthenus]|uniref:enhancer of split m7 protein-like n=1 Tax=Acipenser ruthenus TaxID=7906 RepID=UPI002741DF4F|nr:enhancer of split m7 protein-like [Acipenser ruthenus]